MRIRGENIELYNSPMKRSDEKYMNEASIETREPAQPWT